MNLCQWTRIEQYYQIAQNVEVLAHFHCCFFFYLLAALMLMQGVQL